MTAATFEAPAWPARRWLATVVLVMLGQVGCIFWLTRHQLAARRPVAIAPMVSLAGDDILERLALSNPAQFVLANRDGFSGGAWLQLPALEYDSPEWTEPPRPLALSVRKLGDALNDFVQTNQVGAFELASTPEPQLDPIVPLPDLPTQSTLTVEGELAGRPLLSSFKLDSPVAPEILSNSVVQVGVGRDGSVFSAVLLGGAKDSKEARAADANALNLARSTRFQPLPRTGLGHPEAPDASLQWGCLVFHWHTVAPASTNSASAANP